MIDFTARLARDHLRSTNAKLCTYITVCDTGERPHSCEVCGRTYARAEGLRKHMFEHTGYRPFACSICQRQFNEARNLRSPVFTYYLY